MSNCFRVEIVKPPNYPHWRCLQDHATTVELSLKELARWSPDGRRIIFGANVGAARSQALPTDIVYNLEANTSHWMEVAYVDFLKEHDVLDYSMENVKWLRDRGVRAFHLPIQYHPHLTRLSSPWGEEDKHIDVLFYGSMMPRRLPILKSVEDAGFQCKWLDHDGWDYRDGAIVYSKIVLNLHAYDGAPFEMARVSYLLANKAFVISEGPVVDEYRNAVVFCDPMDIPRACEEWLDDWDWRVTVAQRGFDQFTAKPQRDSLRAVLQEMGAL